MTAPVTAPVIPSAPVIPPAPTPFAEPTKAIGGGWIALFATAWFGIWMAQLTPVQLLLPEQIDALLTLANAAVLRSDRTQSVLSFGIISGIAGACALVNYPLTGALVVAAVGGFPALFLASAIAAILGGLAVIPIKRVR